MTDDTYPDLDLDLDPADGLDAPLAMPREREVPCEFRTGSAGSGKTFNALKQAAEDPSWAVLSSTTGVSAINLGCTTLNSLLGYFDEASLQDIYLSGTLTRKLRALADAGTRNLLIEECSMLTAPALDLLYRACEDVARLPAVKAPLGIILVGDFAQLPPVKGQWCFEAQCWPRFAQATTRLTKIWRQSDPRFLDALNAARRGAGAEAAAMLTDAGARWETGLHTEFDGTTVLSKNDQVGRYNAMALDRVHGKAIVVTSRRWGKQRSEWGQNRRTGEWGVPQQAEFKVGAYVMLLANKFDEGRELVYANGDCGHIEDYEGGAFKVRLVRNGEVVTVERLARNVAQKDKPDGWPEYPRGKEPIYPVTYMGKQHRTRDGYVLGQVEYYPLRLAYASTVHKSQSLSLDRVQVDFRDRFFASPAMLYVALSRCRTLAGLRLVGQRERFAQHCKSDLRVARFL